MKKHFIFILWLLCTVLVFSSCSRQSKVHKLLGQVPEKTDVVVVADVKALFASAGGTVEDGKIVLPDYITDMLSGKDSRELDEALDFILDSGVDLDVCALAVNDIEKGSLTFILALDDKDKFVSAIKENDFDEKDSADGFTFYACRTYESDYDSKYDKYCYIAVGDNYAYVMPDVRPDDDARPVKQLTRMAQDAADASFASTPFADYITSDNSVFGMAFHMPRELRRELRNSGMPEALTDMYQGTFCARTSIGDDAATMRFRLLGEDGKPVDFSLVSKSIDLDARISNKALSYMHSDEFIIGAMAMHNIDWGAITDAIGSQPGVPASYRMGIGLVRTYLENIDGTVAFGLGLSDGLRSMANIDYGVEVMKQFAVTLVVETKPGKASAMASDIKSFIQQTGMTVEQGTGDSFSVDVPRAGGKLYVGGDENVLVISNRPVSDVNTNAAVKSFAFTDYISAGVINLPHTNPLMSQLGIDSDVQFSGISIMPDFESEMSMKITGTDTNGFIARLAQAIISISEASDNYQRMRREVREAKYGPEEEFVMVEDIDSVAIAE